MRNPILTLTMSPCVDLACSAYGVSTAHKNRTSNNRFDPGGGGLNVSKVVHALGGETEAIVLLGGITGRYIDALLCEAGIPHREISVRAPTRMAVAVHDRRDNAEWRFVPDAEAVDAAEWQAALAMLDSMEADWIVASGSLPPGAPDDFYGQVARRAAARGRRVVIDTHGPPLAGALGCGAAIIKPSLREFELLTGRDLAAPAAQEAAARQLVESGAVGMVALTMGEDGALLVGADFALRVPAIPVADVRSTVGAGDSFVAGLVLAFARGATPAEALRWARAAGTSAVSHDGTANVVRAQVDMFRAAA